MLNIPFGNINFLFFIEKYYINLGNSSTGRLLRSAFGLSARRKNILIPEIANYVTYDISYDVTTSIKK